MEKRKFRCVFVSLSCPPDVHLLPLPPLLPQTSGAKAPTSINEKEFSRTHPESAVGRAHCPPCARYSKYIVTVGSVNSKIGVTCLE